MLLQSEPSGHRSIHCRPQPVEKLMLIQIEGRLGGWHFLSPPHHPPSTIHPSFSLLSLSPQIVLIVLQYVAWPRPELQAEVQFSPMLIKSAVCASWSSVCVHYSGSLALSWHRTKRRLACVAHQKKKRRRLPFDPSWRICLMSFYV